MEKEIGVSINDTEPTNVKRDNKEEPEETDPDDPRNEYSKTIENPEDNDGENRFIREEDKETVAGTVVTIVKCIIGCGILNHPLCFKTLGIIASMCVIGFSFIVTISTIYFLMKCKEITMRYGYSMYAKLCFGSYGTFIIKCSIVTMTFGFCCVYLKVFGGIFKSLVELFVVPTDKIYFHPTFYIIVIFFVLMPLMFKEDISALRKFSFIGVVSIMIFLASMITIFIYKYFNGEIQAYTEDMLYPSGDWIQMFVAATSILDSFTFQMNAFPIYLPLKKRSKGRMLKATAISTIIVAFVYSMTGLLGFFMYRNKLNNVVIEYLTGDIHVYKSTNMYISGILFLCTIAFYLSALLSMPLLFFTLKKNLITLITFIKKKVTKTSDDDEEKTLATSLATTQIIMGSMESRTKMIITLIAYIGVLLFTLSVDKIITITSIVGSTVSNVITMLAPATFIFKLSDASFFSFQKLFGSIIFSCGASILLTFFYTKIVVFF